MAACATASPASAPATPTAVIRLWAPPASATAGPAPATPVLVASSTPPPTPVTHQVAKGETLISIAVLYGVALEALQQANPNVQPETLSIGATLIIPLSAEAPPVVAGEPPTPNPLALGEPLCYALAGGAQYCFVEARNPGVVALEAVAARVTLAGADGLPVAEASAQPALEVLAPGESVPLVAFFPAVPEGVAARVAASVSALPLAVPEQSVVLEVTVSQVDLKQPLTTVTGTLRNPSADTPGQARLALAVYDAAGRLTGCSWLTLAPALAPGETRAFQIQTAGLGPAPDHYRLWAEARP